METRQYAGRWKVGNAEDISQAKEFDFKDW
jgi:post-segregation antitoxin (ccd killing protein)